MLSVLDEFSPNEAVDGATADAIGKEAMKNAVAGILSLALGLTLAIALGAQAPPPPGIDDRETLRHLKTVEWPRAYREQDVELLDRILADEFERIGFEGERSSKQDELARVRASRPDYDTFSFEITRLEIFENGTAIVSGIGTVTGVDAEGAYTSTYSSSNVLLKRGAVWKAVASHVSGVSTRR
jgi:hypothetical protein